jgi:hypothetical protein
LGRGEEVHMPERPDDEQDEERSSGEEGSEVDTINDPLTRTDEEAPRKPFGSGPDSE